MNKDTSSTKAIHKSPRVQELEAKETKRDSEVILEAVKALTTTVADLAGKINVMNKTHEKWVKAGKF